MELAAGWTDIVLACTCAVAAAGGPRGAAQGGYVLIGLAAALGAARFLGVGALVPAHDAATDLAALVGVPLVGVGAAFALQGRRERLRLGWAAGALFVALAVPLRGVEAWRTAAGGGAMVVLALVAGRAAWLGRAPGTPARDGPLGPAWLAAAGAAGVLVAGLAVAGAGSFLGMARIAWFHLALAAALGAIAAGARASARERDPRASAQERDPRGAP